MLFLHFFYNIQINLYVMNHNYTTALQLNLLVRWTLLLLVGYRNLWPSFDPEVVYAVSSRPRSLRRPRFPVLRMNCLLMICYWFRWFCLPDCSICTEVFSVRFRVSVVNTCKRISRVEVTPLRIDCVYYFIITQNNV